jgi:hypothetical protein
VRDEEVPFEALRDLAAQLREGGLVAHHRVGDAGERLDLFRNRASGIDERRPFLDETAVHDTHDPDLGDAIAPGRGAGRFEVHEGDRRKRAPLSLK